MDRKPHSLVFWGRRAWVERSARLCEGAQQAGDPSVPSDLGQASQRSQCRFSAGTLIAETNGPRGPNGQSDPGDTRAPSDQGLRVFEVEDLKASQVLSKRLGFRV